MEGLPTPAALVPGRVVRRGKFWALEPLFADEREYPISRSGRTPHRDDIVLCLPVKRTRMQIVEVLGTVDDLPAILKALLYARQIRQGFEDAVVDEAGAVVARGVAGDPARRDLTGLPTFTIDPDTARDFDDAISVERRGDGYRAWVHIADVSFYVDAGGAIDLEARRRTASVYLPLWAEPMLPGELSSGVCSLKPHEDRACITVEFTFDGKGRRGPVTFYRSTIHSDHRLTYGFVDEVLDGRPEDGLGPVPPTAVGDTLPPGTPDTAPSAPNTTGQDAGAALPQTPPATHASPPPHDQSPHADTALRDHLLLAAELAGKLRRARFARGALQIGSFEPEYRFDATGQLVSAAERLESPSHSLVEEFMLAANESVAEFLQRKGAGAIYRVHEAPDPGKADALLSAMEELEVPTPPFPAREAASGGDVAAVLRRLSETLPALSAREGRGKLAFPQLLLRSLKQARYDPQNLGHFGLSSSSYLHFTSPIRRYPDLLVHRALLHELGQGSGAEGPGELHDIAAHCSTMERVIAKVELKADDIALAFLLDRRLFEGGWEQVFSGEIIGVIESGVFVHFGSSFEGYVPARNLPGEYYAQSEWGTALVGRRTGRRFRLGDLVNVRVERVDKLTGKVELSLAEAPPDDGGEGVATKAAHAAAVATARAARTKKSQATNRRRRTRAGAQPRPPR